MEVIDIVRKLLHEARYFDLVEGEDLSITIKGAVRKEDKIILKVEKCSSQNGVVFTDTTYEITLKEIRSRSKNFESK